MGWGFRITLLSSVFWHYDRASVKEITRFTLRAMGVILQFGLFEKTWLCIVSLFRELKAFLKSNFKKVVHLGLSSRSNRFRNECVAIFAPHLVPHFISTLPKKICRSERALLPAHLDAIRLSVLPMPIGLNPPSILMRARSFAQKKGLRGLGNLPSPMRFISLASNFRKISPSLPFDLLTKSLKL